MKLTHRQKQYLANKHKGGINNQKGNTYEVIYETGEIIRLFANGYDMKKTTISSQVPDCFVDDFLIVFNKTKIYHQIKDKKSLSWGKYEHGELLFDFSWQRQLSNSNKEKFKLKIVYSDSTCPVHTKTIPDAIKDVTLKEEFPAYPTLTAYLQASKELQDSICSVMYVPDGNYTLDRQSLFIELIRSQLLELGHSGIPVPLADIKTAYERKQEGFPNFKGDSDVPLTKEFTELLESISNFSYSVNGNIIYWNFSRMNGSIAIDKQLQNKILAANVKSAFDLIQLLN